MFCLCKVWYFFFSLSVRFLSNATGFCEKEINKVSTINRFVSFFPVMSFLGWKSLITGATTLPPRQKNHSIETKKSNKRIPYTKNMIITQQITAVYKTSN